MTEICNEKEKMCFYLSVRIEYDFAPYILIEYSDRFSITPRKKFQIKYISKYNGHLYTLKKDEINLLKILQDSKYFISEYSKFRNEELLLFNNRFYDEHYRPYHKDSDVLKNNGIQMFKNIERYFSDEIKLALEVGS